MAWGDWMVPHLQPEHHLSLERQRRAIDGYTDAQAKAMLLQLAELAMRQELIIRGATRRIAELECQAALWPC